MKEEKAYEILIDAINYRRRILAEKINEKYLPKNLRHEYEEKMEKLQEIDFAFF